ncbi:hypothetical protein PF005_g4922 [Phytophthora fragariae]|uniref:Uncharacterized protein n=2 Tax=Phytophthora fragariae TaxID=53985 RepID=A0A6A3UTB5_9STRA|nr:hypothetical protein PF003_g39637 [Phytophthora fragariae]KAE8947969.1 hypothetical protein PF009_g2447 [Phytophthora fragariae]KAE9028437.1 hypothetical protein PF011_g1558 [Phytophthora fragariae]KAE9136140.1 hypothetical protein PF010_g1796 [Phytophthora fragariae]KAE9154101.1 hypothetical protein PF006_g1820 [Phytophthora fragariae]
MTEKEVYLSGTEEIDSNQRKQNTMRMVPPAGVHETVGESHSVDIENDCEFTIRLDGPIDKGVEEEYKRVIARAFYATGWSFHSVDKTEGKDILQFFANNASLPNLHNLADPHLTREYIHLKVHVIQFIKVNIPYIVIAGQTRIINP